MTMLQAKPPDSFGVNGSRFIIGYVVATISSAPLACVIFIAVLLTWFGGRLHVPSADEVYNCLALSTMVSLMAVLLSFPVAWLPLWTTLVVCHRCGLRHRNACLIAGLATAAFMAIGFNVILQLTFGSAIVETGRADYRPMIVASLLAVCASGTAYGLLMYSVMGKSEIEEPLLQPAG